MKTFSSVICFLTFEQDRKSVVMLTPLGDLMLIITSENILWSCKCKLMN